MAMVISTVVVVRSQVSTQCSPNILSRPAYSGSGGLSNHELVALIFRRLQAYLDYCSTSYDNRVLVHQRTGSRHHWEGSGVDDGEPN